MELFAGLLLVGSRSRLLPFRKDAGRLRRAVRVTRESGPKFGPFIDVATGALPCSFRAAPSCKRLAGGFGRYLRRVGGEIATGVHLLYPTRSGVHAAYSPADRAKRS